MGCAVGRDAGVEENVYGEHYRKERPPIERRRDSSDEDLEDTGIPQDKKKKKGGTWLMQVRSS